MLKVLLNDILSFKKGNIVTSTLVLGIFFLVWSINSYFIGGNILKQFFILLGVFLIVRSSLFSLPRGYLFYRFALISFCLMLLYWGLAFVQGQETTSFVILFFDLICYFLLLSGYLIANNIGKYTFTSSKVLYLIIFFVVFGAVVYFEYQTTQALDSISGASRSANDGSVDDNVNVIGIAYTNAILFFILYHYYVCYKLSSLNKILVVVSILFTIVVMLMTQSRGAMLFLLIVVFINNFHRFNSIVKIFKVIVYLIITILLLIICYIQLVKYFPLIGEKFDATFNRFQLLLEFANDSDADQSAYERTIMLNEFYDNIGSIILFGQNSYKPYPHNQIAEILMRWGLIFGLPLLGSSLFCFFKSSYIIIKKQSVNSICFLIVLLFLFSFLQSLSSMSLEMNRMLWLGLGFLLGYKGLKRDELFNS